MGGDGDESAGGCLGIYCSLEWLSSSEGGSSVIDVVCCGEWRMIDAVFGSSGMIDLLDDDAGRKWRRAAGRRPSFRSREALALRPSTAGRFHQLQPCVLVYKSSRSRSLLSFNCSGQAPRVDTGIASASAPFSPPSWLYHRAQWPNSARYSFLVPVKPGTVLP